MTAFRLTFPGGICKAGISLPGSKSISNRALILHAVSGAAFTLHGISSADDTQIMLDSLAVDNGEVNIGNAGTCMRFLTAWFAANEGTHIKLLCDARMEERPVAELVNALRYLGAEIQYLKNEGFPPLEIHGQKLIGGTVQINADVSSQYISALMMIGPLCAEQLEIEMTGEIASEPYINMTAKLMKDMGFEVAQNNRLISTRFHPHHVSLDREYNIGADWSSASYWYMIAALCPEIDITLINLKKDGMQGDEVISELMTAFGVKSIETSDGIRLERCVRTKMPSGINLLNTPDLAPALAVTAAALGVAVKLTGLKNLAIKESNRLTAIVSELARQGYSANADPDSIVIEGGTRSNVVPVDVNTHDDHRIAMAFAPLALLHPITINDPEVVSKSYPGFWYDLATAGFSISHVGI